MNIFPKYQLQNYFGKFLMSKVRILVTVNFFFGDGGSWGVNLIKPVKSPMPTIFGLFRHSCSTAQQL